MNLYAYVGNDPLGFVDPSGAKKYGVCVTAGCGRGESTSFQVVSNGREYTINKTPTDSRYTQEVNKLSGDLTQMVAETVVDEITAPIQDAIDVVEAIAGGDLTAAGAIAGVAAADVAARGVRLRKLTDTNCCFVAGTLVHTESGPRAIEDIEVGDLVLAKDEESGELSFKPVSGLIRHHDRIIWEVEVAAPDGVIKTFGTTDDHPWWTPGRRLASHRRA